MLPPSDSLRHLADKLAEVRANRSTRIAPPPPPYSSVPLASIEHGILSEIDLGDVDSPSSPITITIDASVHVQGDGNTLLLSSGAGNRQGNPEHQQQQQQQQQQNNTTSPSTTSNGSSTTSSRLQFAQSQRQAKLTEMATTIIAALRDSDMLIDPETGRSRPLNVNLNTGVKVEGSRNVICMGSSIPARIARKGDTTTSTTTTTAAAAASSNSSSSSSVESGERKEEEKDQQKGDVIVDNVNANRKRRAQSEPLNLPSAKRQINDTTQSSSSSK